MTKNKVVGLKNSMLFTVGTVGLIAMVLGWSFYAAQSQSFANKSEMSSESEPPVDSAPGNQNVNIHEPKADSELNEILPADIQKKPDTSSGLGTPADAALEGARTSQEEESLKSYLLRYQVAGELSFSKSDEGQIYQVAAALFDLKKLNTNRDQFALDVARLMSGNSVELDKEEAIHKTALGESFEYEQKLDGIPVHGGYLKLFARESDGVIYHVIQNSKQISQALLDRRFDLEQVTEKIRSQLSGKSLRVSGVPKQYIWVDEKGLAVHCWQIAVSVLAPLVDSRTFVVSSYDLTILADRSNIIN